MKSLIATMLLGAALTMAVPAAQAQQSVTFPLINAAGATVGSAVLRDADDGVLLRVELEGQKSGWNGVHVHATGDCSDHADHFQKAGGHLNDDDTHGFLSKDGPHKGDFPNIWIGADGIGKAEFYNEDLDMDEALGRALMIHEGPDDYMTDPAGASGARIACGVIRGS